MYRNVIGAVWNIKTKGGEIVIVQFWSEKARVVAETLLPEKRLTARGIGQGAFLFSLIEGKDGKALAAQLQESCETSEFLVRSK